MNKTCKCIALFIGTYCMVNRRIVLIICDGVSVFNGCTYFSDNGFNYKRYINLTVFFHNEIISLVPFWWLMVFCMHEAISFKFATVITFYNSRKLHRDFHSVTSELFEQSNLGRNLVMHFLCPHKVASYRVALVRTYVPKIVSDLILENYLSHLHQTLHTCLWP